MSVLGTHHLCKESLLLLSSEVIGNDTCDKIVGNVNKPWENFDSEQG